MYIYDMTHADATIGAIVRVKNSDSQYYRQYGRVFSPPNEDNAVDVYFSDIDVRTVVPLSDLERLR